MYSFYDNIAQQALFILKCSNGICHFWLWPNPCKRFYDIPLI